jgi:hypothetical protein
VIAKCFDVDGEMSMRLRTLLFGLALATTTAAGAKESLTIHVSPATSFAPADLIIRARVEPDVNNRAIEIVADSDEFYRSSTIPLEGERAPKTTTFEFRSLPRGEYAVTASVIGIDGRPRAVARTQVNVIESGFSR